MKFATLLACMLLAVGAAWAEQPANVGDAKIAATLYHESGEYERDLAIVAGEATAWLTSRAGSATKSAIVFDIDETMLSNWLVIKADDFGRVFDGPCDAIPAGPCGWVAWDLSARGVAIAPTLELYRRARALGVATFFISGRDERQREATERNLRAVGYDAWDGLFLTQDGAHFASAADFKAPIRERVEAMGYSIVVNIGDQPSDLAGGHAERTFLLPNPFYRIP